MWRSTRSITISTTVVACLTAVACTRSPVGSQPSTPIHPSVVAKDENGGTVGSGSAPRPDGSLTSTVTDQTSRDVGEGITGSSSSALPSAPAPDENGGTVGSGH